MSIYGQPERTAAQDANAGVVDVPSQREQVKAQGIRAHKAQVTEGDDSFMSAALPVLSAGVNQFLAYNKQVEEQADEDRRIQGAIEQGENLAIVEVIEAEKRTGISEFIFGQDAKYEGAQRQAVVNNIREWGTASMHAIEEHIGDSPQEYKAAINAQFKEHTEQFEGDAETQRLLRAEYEKQASKLMNAYTKERFAYTQQQNYKELSRTIGSSFDAATVDTNRMVPGTADAEKIYTDYASTFDYQTFRANNPNVAGVTEANFNRAVKENLLTSLHNDNATAYLAAQQLGYIDKLTVGEQQQLDNANRARIKRSDFNAMYAKANYDTQILSTDSAEGLVHMHDLYMENSAEHPETFPISAWPGIQTQINRNILRRQNSDQKVMKKAAEKQASKLAVLQSAQQRSVGDFSGTSALTKKEQAQEKTVLAASRIRGNGTISMDDVSLTDAEIETMLHDPVQAEQAARNLKDVADVSVGEKNFMRNTVNGAFHMVDDNDRITPEGALRIESVLKYDSYRPGTVMHTIGEKETQKLYFLKDQMDSDVPMKDALKTWEARDESIAVRTDWGYRDVQNGKPKAHTKKSALLEVFQRETGVDYPDDEEFDRFVQSYDMWEGIHRSQSAAMRSAIQAVRDRDETIIGRSVRNGRVVANTIEEHVDANPRVMITGGIELEQAKASQFAEKDDDGNYYTDQYAATPTELVNFMQRDVQFQRVFRSLGMQVNNETGQFDPRELQQSNIVMEVPYGTNTLRFTARTAKGRVVQDIPLHVFREIQNEYSLEQWRLEQHTLIDKEESRRHFMETQSRGYMEYGEAGELITPGFE